MVKVSGEILIFTSGGFTWSTTSGSISMLHLIPEPRFEISMRIHSGSQNDWDSNPGLHGWEASSALPLSYPLSLFERLVSKSVALTVVSDLTVLTCLFAHW